MPDVSNPPGLTKSGDVDHDETSNRTHDGDDLSPATLEVTDSITDPEGNTVTSLPDPVRVTDEAVTFTESDVTVTTNGVNVSNGAIGLFPFASSTATTKADNDTFRISGLSESGIVIEPKVEVNKIVARLGGLFDASGGPTVARIRKSNNVQVAGADISSKAPGDTVTFSGLSLAAGEQYRLVATSSDDHNVARNDNPNYPYTSTLGDIVTGFDGSNDSGRRDHFDRVEFIKTGTNSGNALIEWDDPADDIRSWDLATFQSTGDGETVTVDVGVRTNFSQVASNSFEGTVDVITPSGDKIYSHNDSQNDIIEYTLSAPFDVTTASESARYDVFSETSNFSSVEIANSGSKMYVGGTNGNIFEYNLSNAYDISSATYVHSSSELALNASPTGISFVNGGNDVFVALGFLDDVAQYSLTTPYDVTTLSQQTRMGFNNTVNAIAASPGGKNLITSVSGNGLEHYTLSTAFDLSTAALQNSQSVSTDGLDYAESGGALLTGGGEYYKLADTYSLASEGFGLQNADVPRNFDISAIDTSENVLLRANLSRNNTANDPTLDYAARRFTR